MASTDDETWIRFQVDYQHKEAFFGGAPAFENATPLHKALLMTSLIFLGVFVVVCVMCISKRVNICQKRKREGKIDWPLLIVPSMTLGAQLILLFVHVSAAIFDAKGKNLAKPLSPRKWTRDEMEITSFEETESCSGSDEDEVAASSDGGAQQRTQTNKKLDHLCACQICSESFQEGEDIIQSNNPICGHIFHQKCIEKWLNYQYACPICSHVYVLQEV